MFKIKALQTAERHNNSHNKPHNREHYISACRITQYHIIYDTNTPVFQALSGNRLHSHIQVRTRTIRAERLRTFPDAAFLNGPEGERGDWSS